MAQHAEAHEESEVVADMSRLLRTAGMAGMQLSESVQRRRQHRERMEQARETEKTRRTDMAVTTVARNAHSKQFWEHSGNRALADNLLTAQQLGAQGHEQANNAYMLMADTIRDRYGMSVEPLVRASSTPDNLYERLCQALDDHNQKGREIDALRDAHERQLDAAIEAQREKDELYAAARPEAEAAGMDVDPYLESLSEAQRAQLLADAREVEGAEGEKTLAEAQAATSPEARREAGAEAVHGKDQVDETQTEAAHERVPGDDAAAVRASAADAREDRSRADERLAEHQQADQFSAERRTRGSAAHDAGMDRHLAKAAKTDPQAAQALRSARETTPSGGRDHLQRSSQTKVAPSKGRTQSATAGREHVRSR